VEPVQRDGLAVRSGVNLEKIWVGYAKKFGTAT